MGFQSDNYGFLHNESITENALTMEFETHEGRLSYSQTFVVVSTGTTKMNMEAAAPFWWFRKNLMTSGLSDGPPSHIGRSS